MVDPEGSSKPINKHAPCCGELSNFGEVSKHPKLERLSLVTLENIESVSEG